MASPRCFELTAEIEEVECDANWFSAGATSVSVIQKTAQVNTCLVYVPGMQMSRWKIQQQIGKCLALTCGPVQFKNKGHCFSF